MEEGKNLHIKPLVVHTLRSYIRHVLYFIFHKKIYNVDLKTLHAIYEHHAGFRWNNKQLLNE